MKLKINKIKFERELEIISKAIKSNSPLVALQGILIEVNESYVKLISSNGNLSIKEIINDNSIIQIIEPGKILINAYVFKNIIKKQGNNIIVEKENKTLKITSEGSIANIQLFETSDYPIISFENEGEDVVVDSDTLNKVISNVSFASAENDSKRVILNGVNLSAKNGVLKAIATNSFRLAIESFEIDTNNEFNITILTRNLKDFIPKQATGPIKINVNDNKIITTFKNTTIYSKLIDGIYPDVTNSIPTKFNSIMSIDSKFFIELLDKATALSQEGQKIVRLNINKEKILIESKKHETGNIRVTSNEFNWSGEDFSIIVNAVFLREAAQRFEGQIALAFNDEFDPIIIKGKSNEKLTQLILPLRSY